MTVVVAPTSRDPLSGTPDTLDRCLATLLEAADAAQALGIETEAVRTAHADAVRRMGFPGDAYVLGIRRRHRRRQVEPAQCPGR